MAYTLQDFKDGSTLNASQLIKIENGIIANENNIQDMMQFAHKYATTIQKEKILMSQSKFYVSVLHGL